MGGMTVAKEMIAIRVDPEWRALLDELMSLEGRDRSDTLRELVADGLRLRMREHSTPIDRCYISGTPDHAVRIYREFLDAVASELGIAGVLGNKHVLMPTPGGDGSDYIPVWTRDRAGQT